jgi:hypothetical protein
MKIGALFLALILAPPSLAAAGGPVITNADLGKPLPRIDSVTPAQLAALASRQPRITDPGPAGASAWGPAPAPTTVFGLHLSPSSDSTYGYATSLPYVVPTGPVVLGGFPAFGVISPYYNVPPHRGSTSHHGPHAESPQRAAPQAAPPRSIAPPVSPKPQPTPRFVPGFPVR